MRKAIIAAIIIVAVFACGYAARPVPHVPNCPTEDSCTYYHGAWHEQ